MNRRGFIEELMKKTNFDEEKCTLIIDTYEENFIIGKKNKEKTINNLISKLNFSEKDANEIYEICSSIVCSGIKDKLKHPSRSKD